MMRLKMLPVLIVILDFQVANALTNDQYVMIQESGYLILWLACIALAASIYSGTKGGSLGLPWMVLLSGFVLAAAASLVQLLDLFKIAFIEYDFRPFVLIARLGSALILLVGLFFYRRGLE
jgi:hypothetical protein